MKELYLIKMGMDDNEITGDIKNHRVRIAENIDIIFGNEKYNMFFEFSTRQAFRVRTTDKRNGRPLKHSKVEIVNKNGIAIDTEYEKEKVETLPNGSKYMWKQSYRNRALESEAVYSKEVQPDFCKKTILDIINTYAIEKYNKITFIDEKATDILKNGGFREKDILARVDYFKKSETWTDEHKVVNVYAKRDADGHRDTCSVDLVTLKIVG